MPTANFSWNGSTLTFGGAGVAPLTDLHQPNEPADYDTTGSTDATHTHGAGLPKNSFTANFLGSKCAAAGTVCAIASSIGAGSSAGGSPATKTYSGALLTQVSVQGRKDGRIEGSLTAVPAADGITPVTHTWVIGALGFNGSTISFATAPLTGIVSINYAATAQAIECTGAEGSDNLYAPGIPDETLTVTCLGGPQAAAKAIGATVVVWNDGGSLGSFTHAKLMSTRPGGSIDGQATTEYTFKPIRSETTADD